MTKHLLSLTLVCVACQSLGPAGAQTNAPGGSLTLQSPDSSIARAILPKMQAWRVAVLKRDTASLVRVALPEYREGIAEALDDPRSPLWRALFDGTQSYRAFLEDPSTNIAIFEHHLILETHNQATACFFKNDIEWPTDFIALQQLAQRRPVRCLNWVFAEEGEWFVSYGFGMPESGRRQ